MADYYFPSPSGNTTDIRESGTIVKIIKKNSKFKVIKTNKPTIGDTISLTATPVGSPNSVTQWSLSYNNSETTTDDNLDRSDTSLPDTNATINIYDTDLLSILVLPKTFSNAGEVANLILTSNASSHPYQSLSVGSVVNNPENSGVIKWNPGVGNTGTFFYRWKDSLGVSSAGGTINVTSTT